MQTLKTSDESRVKDQFLKVIHSLFLQVLVIFYPYTSPFREKQLRFLVRHQWF